MAIVVDPDLLDRTQVLYNTTIQKISFFPTGSNVLSGSEFNAGASAKAATVVFRDGVRTGGTSFSSEGVAIGDILCILSGSDADHYVIASAGSSSLKVDTFDGFATFAGGSGLFYAIRSDGGNNGSGSSLATDGATEQAIYSFTKEEWRNDVFNSTTLAASDNLIKHEFPFEPITSEQFEIGGGAAHADWTWSNAPASTDTTVHYIRTGGWADKNTAASTKFEYTGIVTLGNIDTDGQVYFVQVDPEITPATTPIDFILPGPVNQAILTFDDDTSDFRSFLRLFVRKKARSYAQSELSDIGVTTIQTIVNRFPLAHATDTAIIATDGQLVSASPWSASLLSNIARVKAIDGSITAACTFVGGSLISGSNPGFASNGVRPGDTLLVQTGTGFTGSTAYHILSVPSSNILVVDTVDGNWVAATDVNMRVLSRDVIFSSIDSTGDSVGSNVGVAASSTASTGLFTASGVNFSALGVSATDFLIITGSGAGTGSTFLEGAYKINSFSGDGSTLLISTSADQAFPPAAAAASNLDFRIVKPGMELQQKASTILSTSAVTSLAFASATNRITRAAGDWTADGVLEFDVITVGGTVLNNSSFTVASVGTTTLTVAPSYQIVEEAAVASTAGASATVVRHFVREIPVGATASAFPYRWRIFSNSGDAQEVFQWVQFKLRQTSDIDQSNLLSRGDITDLLMSFATPTGTTFDMFIDDLDLDDINNVTFRDATGIDRLFPFVSTITLQFNNNLQNDAGPAKFWVFFTNDDSGDNLARDYGTKDALIIQDSTTTEVVGNVAGATFQFDYSYTTNIQRGAASAGTDAPMTVVAIGLSTAQFVITTGTITQAKGIVVSLVSSLERNYSNP